MKNHLLMTTKEKEISKRDQDQIHKIFGKLKLEIKHPSVFTQFMLLSNQALQARLIDFVQDAFIAELLVGITKYMVLCE